jgi:hypothetical protein
MLNMYQFAYNCLGGVCVHVCTGSLGENKEVRKSGKTKQYFNI